MQARVSGAVCVWGLLLTTVGATQLAAQNSDGEPSAAMPSANAPAGPSPAPQPSANDPFRQRLCTNLPAGLKPDSNYTPPLISVTITAQGEMRDARILKASGNQELDKAVVSCA